MHSISAVLCGITMAMCGPTPQQNPAPNDGQPLEKQNEHAQTLDNFANRLVGNGRIRDDYLNCFLDNGPCSPAANGLKRKSISIFYFIILSEKYKTFIWMLYFL